MNIHITWLTYVRTAWAPPKKNRWRARHRGKNEANKTTKMSILDLGQCMFRDVDQQIGWFQSKGLLATNKTCPACSQPMEMQKRSDVTDKYRYVYNNSAKYNVPRA